MQTPNGILPVDKAAGWTSFDVLAKLRGALGTRKLGHSGTLDPMATGVLAVFIGKATAAADRQLDHDKTYEATLRLGLRTDTGDVTGETLETAPVTVGAQELCAVLPQFRGDRMQLPPMYSAVKINGQPLYKAARKGQTVERTPRPITIYDIEYLGSPAQDEYTIRVACSKGTYIRTLLEDIADALGQKGTMSAIFESPISPSISALGVSAATESMTMMSMALERISESAISNACSPLSGCEISRLSTSTPNFWA